jgi:hypothetical protein
MSKNVIMILVALLAVVGIGLWVQYSMVQTLRSSATLPIPTTTTTTTTTTGATSANGSNKAAPSSEAPTVGKKTTLTAPVHKH